MNSHLAAVMAVLMLTGAASAAPAPKLTAEEEAALEACERIALARVQGDVLERRPQRYPTRVNYEYLIRARDGRNFVVAVDGKTRKVFAIMEEGAPEAAQAAPEAEAEEPSPE